MKASAACTGVDLHKKSITLAVAREGRESTEYCRSITDDRNTSDSLETANALDESSPQFLRSGEGGQCLPVPRHLEPERVRELLRSSGVFPSAYAAELPSARVRLTGARRNSFVVYRVTLKQEEFVVRFPPDPRRVGALQREAQIAAVLRRQVKVTLPKPEIVFGTPVFAVHRRVSGRALDNEGYRRLGELERERLADDLTVFMRAMWSIPLAEARGLLSVPGPAGAIPVRLKPGFFSPAAVAAMRPRFADFLPVRMRDCFEETAAAFQGLPEDQRLLTLAHGDLWYRNMAFKDDMQGVKLHGIFDFGSAGLLDVHDELFRAGMFGRDFLRLLVRRCRNEQLWRDLLQPQRLEVYDTAFLFHMADFYRRHGRSETANYFRRRLFEKMQRLHR